MLANYMYLHNDCANSCFIHNVCIHEQLQLVTVDYRDILTMHWVHSIEYTVVDQPISLEVSMDT